VVYQYNSSTLAINHVIWKNWNEVLHGKKAEEEANLKNLKDKVKQYYSMYKENSLMILPRYKFLFTNCDLDLWPHYLLALFSGRSNRSHPTPRSVIAHTVAIFFFPLTQITHIRMIDHPNPAKY
jgi:hypothetical protein